MLRDSGEEAGRNCCHSGTNKMLKCQHGALFARIHSGIPAKRRDMSAGEEHGGEHVYTRTKRMATVSKQNQSGQGSCTSYKFVMHRMGMIPYEFPLLYRAGLIVLIADLDEYIGNARDDNRIDFIHLCIFPKSLDRAIRDWTKDRVDIF